MAKRYFAEHDVAYDESDVSHDRDALKDMLTMTGQYAVPVVRVGDKAIVGWNHEEFDRLLRE